MNILLNLIPVRQGGGQQVAANFIQKIIDNNGFSHKWFILVSKNSELENLLISNKYADYIAVDTQYSKRLLFEYIKVNALIKEKAIDICYSYGPGLPNLNVPSVVRSAYSNLYFPEIDFWGNWPLFKRMIFKSKDYFRLSRTLKADALMFENNAMRTRAISLFNYTEDNTIFIKPSLSNFNQNITELPPRYQNIPSGFNIIMLTGWHKNKNIDLVPDILHQLKSKFNVKDVNFIITVSPNHKYSQELITRAKQLNVEKNIIFFNTVPVTEVKFLYEKADAVILLSLLECFSSNIIEAWGYKRPLIISDEIWSNEICKGAAIYVKRSDAFDIAEKIKKLKENKDFYQSIVEAGIKEKDTYPDTLEKAKMQVRFLEKIYSSSHSKKQK